MLVRTNPDRYRPFPGGRGEPDAAAKAGAADGPALGSAMLAAVGAGIYPDIPTAAGHMVHTADTIEPDAERHEEYKFFVERYLETYPQMKEIMHKTERHVAGGGEAEDA